jgi:predicted alpha-1,2-mannosidase
MKVTTFYFILLLQLIGISCFATANNPVDYIDPYIGTGDHGHVFLGAHVPFGAVQVGPNNYVKGWDWCSGYHYSDSIITGFSQTHLSGTGIGDLGDVLIMPYTGEVQTTPGNINKPLSGYATLYTHADEVAKAGYYSIWLKEYAVKAELTATERVGYHKYTFPASSQARIAIDLGHGIGWDKPVETYLKKLDDLTYVGYRFSSGWSRDQRLYFAIRLSKPAQTALFFDNDKPAETIELKSEKAVVVLSYNTIQNEEIFIKVGISPVSETNALANIVAETQNKSFETIRAEASEKWNNELAKISIKSNNNKDLRTFYTAMYHAFTAPALFNDHNRDYRGTDKNVYSQAGFDNYSVFSLWDTYRAAHPLYTLVQPERVTDMIKSMLAIYQQQGKLPIWALMGCETDCMVGYSAIPVVADAIFKNFVGIDAELALEAMKASSTRDDYGMQYIKKMGYIPADKEKESVSKALEYAVSDWCIAQLAQKLGKKEDAEYYMMRAKAYELYYDNESRFLRPKLENGQFRTPFSPIKAVHDWGDYTEGNGWQYAWLVPQDVEGLIKLYGGEKAFSQKLDSLFVVQGDMGEHASPDISGLIGQYAHGNEPSHHITYLYAYAGEHWKSAEKVREIMKIMYHDQPAGLSGNEDCGQMSAWYILSAMGFYPVNPAAGCFVFGSPLFDEMTLLLPQSKSFKIIAKNNSSKNIYIQSVKLNGKKYSNTFITYKDIVKGGTIEFSMGEKPNKKFGSKLKNRPQSKVY